MSDDIEHIRRHRDALLAERRLAGPYTVTQWTDEVRHADPCDCDEDSESVGAACMANSDWYYCVCIESGEWLRPVYKLPRRPPDPEDVGDEDTPLDVESLRSELAFWKDEGPHPSQVGRWAQMADGLDLDEIRVRAGTGRSPGCCTCVDSLSADIFDLLAEVDRQAAEIERLRTLADALAFPVEDSP